MALYRPAVTSLSTASYVCISVRIAGRVYATAIGPQSKLPISQDAHQDGRALTQHCGTRSGEPGQESLEETSTRRDTWEPWTSFPRVRPTSGWSASSERTTPPAYCCKFQPHRRKLVEYARKPSPRWPRTERARHASLPESSHIEHRGVRHQARPAAHPSAPD
jgi:hypothetical protein